MMPAMIVAPVIVAVRPLAIVADPARTEIGRDDTAARIVDGIVVVVGVVVVIRIIVPDASDEDAAVMVVEESMAAMPDPAGANAAANVRRTREGRTAAKGRIADTTTVSSVSATETSVPAVPAISAARFSALAGDRRQRQECRGHNSEKAR